MPPFHKGYYESWGGRRALRIHFVVPSWRGGSDPHTAGAKNRLQPGRGTKTGYSSSERQVSVGIRSDPAPRTLFHKTVVLCRLSIKAITSLGAVAERYVRILLSRRPRFYPKSYNVMPARGVTASPPRRDKNRLQLVGTAAERWNSFWSSPKDILS